MLQPTPQLFDTDVPVPAGYVSPACRFYDDENLRLILVDDQLVYSYDRDDRLATRQVWVMVYESGLATYAQIAAATGISVRALQYWVARYRQEGAPGLPDRPRSGAPRKVTPALRSKIYRLRDLRLTYREIARRCTISVGAVCEALTERQRGGEARQHKLPLTGETEAVDADGPFEQPGNSAEAGGAVAAATTDSATGLPDSQPCAAIEITAPPGGWDDRREAEMAVDRTPDRLLAAAGVLEDAEPLFAPCERLEFAGAFLAVVAIATDPFLRRAQEAYGSFGAAFYGVRTMLLTLLVMALLRIKRPEWLRRHNAEKLGRILGLDRAPEVKTVRRRLRHFERSGRATELMRELARDRAAAYEGSPHVVQVDGHQLVYHGKEKIGEVFSSRCKKVVKAETDNWVGLPHGFPLMVVTCEFNQGLSQVLSEVLETTRRELGFQRLTCCFDRGGYNVLLFEQLIAAGFDIITYRKGQSEPLPESCFPAEAVTVNSRTYPRGLCDRTVELKVYEPVDRGLDKRPGRRDTKRTLKLREIRALRKDGGQTAVLTSCPAAKHSAEEVAGLLFDRIGSQENVFKYLREEFLLDALMCYGSEPLAGDLDHPNPDYVKLEKEAAGLRRKRNRLLGKYADVLIGIDADTAADHLRQLRRDTNADRTKLPASKRKSLGKDAEKLAEIRQRLAEIAAEMEQTPAREKLTESGYRRLKSELRQFMNTLKISAYHIETDLVKLLSAQYANAEDEGRSVIAAALRSTGSLRLEPGRLVIRLEPQAEPRRTRAINHVANELTARRVRFPGSRRLIVFEPTPVPPPPPASDGGKNAI